MSNHKNVQIPEILFKKIINFFECVNIANYTFPNCYDFHTILSELQRKQHNINLHNNYTRIKQAKDDGQKRLAYADYLKLKRRSD